MTPAEAKLAVRDILQPRITKEKEAAAMDIIIDLVAASPPPYRGRYNYSTNLFPEEGGVGDLREEGGRPLPGDYYIGADGVTGTLEDPNGNPMEIPERSTLTYIGAVDGDMQDGVNWKINQG